jgi:hypothetical protein
VRLIAYLTIPALLLGQQQPRPPVPKPAAVKPQATLPPAIDPGVSALQSQISEMRKELEFLRGEVKKYDSWFEGRDSLAQFYREKVDSVIKQSVTLDPSEKGYGIITTNSGHFFVSLDNVEPFLDGYRIVLRIGNPYAITFRDVRINAAWNKKFPSDISKYNEWAQTRRTQEFSESTELKPASWTTFRLALTETKPDQLGYLEIKLSTAGVRMSQ